MFAYQHVEKQHGKPIRILFEDTTLSLLLRDPGRHNVVGGRRPGLEKKKSNLAKPTADLHHEPMEFENFWRQAPRKERMTDLSQLGLQAARGVHMNCHGDVLAL